LQRRSEGSEVYLQSETEAAPGGIEVKIEPVRQGPTKIIFHLPVVLMGAVNGTIYVPRIKTHLQE
jgi:hypothetical protein